MKHKIYMKKMTDVAIKSKYLNNSRFASSKNRDFYFHCLYYKFAFEALVFILFFYYFLINVEILSFFLKIVFNYNYYSRFITIVIISYIKSIEVLKQHQLLSQNLVLLLEYQFLVEFVF